MRKTVTVTATPERITFASARREAAIETAVRIGADGRILGFGDSGARSEGQRRPLFSPGASETAAVDEKALVVLCRRGFALVLGPWPGLRPRVVVRGAKRWGFPRQALVRALQSAGAEAVEFAD